MSRRYKPPFVAFPLGPAVNHYRQASSDDTQGALQRLKLSNTQHTLTHVFDIYRSTEILEELKVLHGSKRVISVEAEFGTGLLYHDNARSRVQELLGELQPQQLSLAGGSWTVQLLDIGMKPNTVPALLESALLSPIVVNSIQIIFKLY